MTDQTGLSDEQWQQYEEQGYLVLGRIMSDDALAALQQRIDDIMLGRATVEYSKMLMQLDSESGKYDETGEQTKGHKGATLNYRKIQDLEFDPTFLRMMQQPIFRDACARQYGPDTPVSCYRAMFMNKPAKRGTWLPWHQDRWTRLNKDPLVTIWMALDPATVQNGCVQIIPGSHKLGLINPEHPSGFLTDEQAAEHAPAHRAVHLELAAGEVALLHNWLLHGSDINRSEHSRRAFSVCYAEADTAEPDGQTYPVIFGDGALRPQSLAMG